MSEYQYHEFAAVDRPLDERQLAEVRELSTRAHLMPPSFVNTYRVGQLLRRSAPDGGAVLQRLPAPGELGYP